MLTFGADAGPVVTAAVAPVVAGAHLAGGPLPAGATDAAVDLTPPVGAVAVLRADCCSLLLC